MHTPNAVSAKRDEVTSIAVQVADSGGDLTVVYWTQPENGVVRGERRVFAEPIYEYSASLQYQPSPCWLGQIVSKFEPLTLAGVSDTLLLKFKSPMFLRS